MKITKMTLAQKNKINKLALYGLILFVAFAIADLTIIYYRDRLLPNQAPPKKAIKMDSFQGSDRSQYSVITSRNLFSSKNEIPDALKAKNDGSKKKNDDPVPSALPITLIGTLVHTDPLKSVAAVEIKSKNMTGSFTVGAEMEGLAKLEKVERGIIYFRNLNNGALEYIEMNKGNSKVSFDNAKTTPTALPTPGKEIQNLGNNTFKVKRTDLNKYLNDMSGLLMQARALPNRDPNTGEINGYRLVDYQPGSIFEQLGLPRGTLIKTAGGEPVNSIQSAMEMFNKMKVANTIKLGVEMNGSDQVMNYNIE
jgi:general secretion pathway protein C